MLLTVADTKRDERGFVQAAADFLLCLAASLAWSWSYLRVLDVTLRDPYDGEAQAWVLAWVRHAVTSSPLTLFQANILAPARDVLAFTEPLIGYGFLSLPFSLAGLSTAGSLNAVCLLMLALVPFGIASLCRALGAPRIPSLLGGFAAAFAPLSAANLGFVYFSAWGGIALTLAAVESFLRQRSLRSGLVAGVALGVMGWFSLQLFAFTVAALVAFTAVRLLTVAVFRQQPTTLSRGLPGVLLSGLILLPLAWTLLSVRQREGFTRDEAETRRYSATVSSWATSTPSLPAHRFLKTTTSEAALYPGSVTLLLGLGALLLVRRGAPHVPAAIAGTVLALLGVLASFGFGGPVYPLLVKLLPPLFGGIRSAFRFAYVAETGFGVLAAAGVWAVLNRLQSSRNPAAARAVFSAVAGLGIFLEGAPRFRFDHRPPLAPSATDRLLSTIEPGGPILFLPLTHRPAETRLMLRSALWGFRPMVNGNISYIPERHRELARALGGEEIDPAELETLERWPAGLIVCPDAALPVRQRGPLLRFLRMGLDSGRLEGPLLVRESGEPVFVFGVRDSRRNAGLAALGNEGRAEFIRATDNLPAPPGAEDPDLPAAIDEPSEGQLIRGDLKVRGWAQSEKGPAQVIDVRIQGLRRTPRVERRYPRPDVGAALPRLGDTSAAGYEWILPRQEGDSGEAIVDVTFQEKDGRIRTLRTRIRWAY